MTVDKSKSKMCSFFKQKLNKVAEHWTHDASVMYPNDGSKI